jgi:hypothetical protein
LPYLVGIKRPNLLACIEKPVTKLNLQKKKEAELVEAAIWMAIDRLVRFSQISVIN